MKVYISNPVAWRTLYRRDVCSAHCDTVPSGVHNRKQSHKWNSIQTRTGDRVDGKDYVK